MIANNGTTRRALAILALTVATLLAGIYDAPAMGAVPPIKEIQTSSIGWEVNETTKAGICLQAEKCQPGRLSQEPGGFEYPWSIAGAGHGSNDIYVVDRNNHRIQELEADGKFVLMFGKDVNRKGGDLCTASETGQCQAGQEGEAPGEFAAYPMSIAVDPVSGDIFVAEFYPGERRSRLQEFEPGGEFVLELGREVNETKTISVKGKGGAPAAKEIEEENLCTQEEIKNSGVKCTGPTAGSSPEPGAFEFSLSKGNSIAVGGPEDLLYVGDEHRVQKFIAGTGHYDGELSLTSLSAEPGVTVQNLAVDQETGKLYLVYANERVYAHYRTIYEFGPTGTELGTITTVGNVDAIAVDPHGRLAVSEDLPSGHNSEGSLYEVHPLHIISAFNAHGTNAMAFNAKGELYAVFSAATATHAEEQEVIAYEPVPIGELVATKPTCSAGSERDTDATLDCTLHGEVDPWGISETEVWFRWGATEALEEKTAPPVKIPNLKSPGEEEPMTPVGAPLTVGVPPNEILYEQLVGEDHNVKSPEQLTSGILSFTTNSVPPRLVGEPMAAFATASSIVLFGQLNPENAPTSYEFEYAPEGGCEKNKLEQGESLEKACNLVMDTGVLKSSAYGKVGVVQEITGLQPATSYRYRLTAVNEVTINNITVHEEAVNETGGGTLPSAGIFQTAPAPVVTAQTGPAGVLTTTSARITGSVDPDGQPSTYTFEVGLYNGAQTHYGTVFSGSAGSGTAPVPEELTVTGLQPGTTYAYRITIHYGDGTLPNASAIGNTEELTTLGIPVVLVPPGTLPMLSAPSTPFPKPTPIQKSKKTKKKKTQKKKTKKSKKGKKADNGAGRKR